MLSANEVLKLYHSTGLSKSHARGYATRLIFGIELMTAMRPGELYELRMMDVTYHECESKQVIRIVNTIWIIDGKSKTMEGGLQSVSEKPLEILFRKSNRLMASSTCLKILRTILMLSRSSGGKSTTFFALPTIGSLIQ